MNDSIKQAAVSTKNFVSKHRVAIAVCITVMVMLPINNFAVREHNKFLKEKGLYDEFYTPEDSYDE